MSEVKLNILPSEVDKSKSPTPEVLTINTESGIAKQEKIEPLPLYDDGYYMLQQVMPEYTDPLPNPLMNNLIGRLKNTMKRYNGLGLAANQCGVQQRVFVMGTDDYQLTCINPKVIETSETGKKDGEGCLSFPGLNLKVDRPEWIIAEFTDENGERKQMKMEGVTARCFMHELDHMNGIKFTQRVGPVALQMAKQKQEKLKKKVVRTMNKLGMKGAK